MKIFLNKNKLIKFINSEKNLGFVPTMGAIHKGHESLIKKSKKLTSKTIVTIYINKPQFNKAIDFKKYPRVLKKDISKLKKLKIDFLYLPKTKEIYPKGQNKKIRIDPFSKDLCGRFRPGHFKGVIDVVDRFIKIIKPKKIFLGEKDMQQLKLIESHTKKYNKGTKVISCKTIRENNGLAYSSRNFFLSDKEKIIASKIYRFLKYKRKNIIKSKLSINKIKNTIYKIGAKKIDYIKILDINKVIKPYKKIKRYRIFIAYYLSTTRLIDNI